MFLLFQAIWTVTRVYILLSAARKDSPRILPVMPKPHSVPISQLLYEFRILNRIRIHENKDKTKRRMTCRITHNPLLSILYHLLDSQLQSHDLLHSISFQPTLQGLHHLLSILIFITTSKTSPIPFSITLFPINEPLYEHTTDNHIFYSPLHLFRNERRCATAPYPLARPFGDR